MSVPATVVSQADNSASRCRDKCRVSVGVGGHACAV
jgi:hypothetical protein